MFSAKPYLYRTVYFSTYSIYSLVLVVHCLLYFADTEKLTVYVHVAVLCTNSEGINISFYCYQSSLLYM